MYEHDQFQILTRIFAFLSLRDRKEVRLTCKLWYNCSLRLSITNNEKFMFRAGSNLQDIAKVLMKPNFLQMNLRFEGLSLSLLPAHTWNVCGHRIHSLEFDDCKWNDEAIKDIIVHCVNMKRLKIDNWVYGVSIGNIFNSTRLFDELIEKNVQRTELHTFTMLNPVVHENVLEKIFTIYPCIKDFSTGSCLNLNSFTQFESLRFNLPSDPCLMKRCMEHQGLRFVQEIHY